jgi:hypothetical protein
MKQYLLLFAVVASYGAFAQQPVKEYNPITIVPMELSVEGEQKRKQDEAQFPAILDKRRKGTPLTADEQRIHKRFIPRMEMELPRDYWSTTWKGCEGYCGGSPQSVTASSELKQQGGNTYTARNARDFSYKTAWVEGVPGPGIGEYLVYTFPPEASRIVEIIVANGYIKSERAYRDNGRVKKLQVYWNDEPFGILHLEDRRSAQHFYVPEIGHADRTNLSILPPWTLKFEILEVYKGAKYDDTVIAEIFFEGLDAD